MTKLLRRALLLVAVVALINRAIAPALPYPWGNEVLDAKLRHLRDHREIDALIVGSSWTYRHLDPAVFDAALGGKAFNLATDGAHAPQSRRILDAALALDERPYRFLLVELARFISAVDPELGRTKEEKHWLTWRDTLSMARGLRERPDKNVPQKLVQGGLLALQLGERYFHVGLGADALDHRFGPPAATSLLGRQANGFYPVDDEGEDRDPGKTFGNAFLADPRAAEFLDKLRAETLAAFERFERDPRSASASEHARLFRALIDRAAARGIPVFFVVPPRLGSRYDHALPVAAALPPERVLAGFADPRRHPELFALELSVDRTHFNRVGAARYSALVAAALRERLHPGEAAMAPP